MSVNNRPERTLSGLRKAAEGLFENIFASPGSYDVSTNPQVAQIHKVWKSAKTEEVEPELVVSLRSPHDFVARVAPKNDKRETGEVIRGLGQRVGIYMETEGDVPYGIQKVYKTGWLAKLEKPLQGDDWVKVEGDSHVDTFVRRSILEEVETSPRLDVYGSVFHATTSAALDGIGRRRGIVSSGKILDTNPKDLKSGEVLGSRSAHDQVFVDPNKIIDSYGVPAWFNEYGVAFGISMEKQESYLKRNRKQTGTFSSSEGWKIGERVPLKNVEFITASAAHIEEVRKWAQKHCPDVKVVSREVVQLKYRR